MSLEGRDQRAMKAENALLTVMPQRTKERRMEWFWRGEGNRDGGNGRQPV